MKFVLNSNNSISKQIAAFAIIFFSLSSSISAQLGGNYSISSTGSGSYLTISDAVADLYNVGISAPVTFTIIYGTYNEQVEFSGPIPGASAINTITFESDSGLPEDVTVTYSASSTLDNFVWKINDVKYLTIKDITISAGGTDYATAILLENPQGELSFSNNIITGNNSASIDNNQSLVVCNNTGSLNNVTFTNNRFKFGFSALYLYPNSSSSGLLISGNGFSNLFKRGVSINNFSAPQIISNTFQTVEGYAIYLYNCSNNFLVEKNTISNSLASQNWGIQAINCSGTSAANGLIVNNFIQAMNTGIKLENSTYVNVYNNSLNIEDPSGSALITSAAFKVTTGNGNIRAVNNIFANQRDGYAYLAETLSGSQIVSSDYNDLITSGVFIGQWDGIDRATFSDFQTASGLDVNSFNVNPAFVSISDLHSTSGFLDNEGTPLASVSDDIDGEARDASTPSVGADEFQYFQGTYTIGSGGDFSTINSAIAQLMKGITGSVTFNILSGTYNEQINIYQPITGTSAANVVTFQSATGNSADVVISTSATNALSNYVIKTEAVSYLSFRNLTFSASGSTYARVLYLGNSAGNITFSNNIFNGYAASTATEQDLVICENGSLDNVLFEYNEFNNGYSGLNLTPAIVSSGVSILGNSFNSQAKYGVSLYNFTAPSVVSNSIQNAELVAINLEVCNGASRVEKNDIIYSNTGSVTGISISGCAGLSAAKGLIANNFIQSTYQGISMTTSSYIDVYHNSVNIEASDSTSNLGSAAIFFLFGNSNLNVGNNIFVNKRNGYAYNVNASGSSQIAVSDYNDLYSTGVNLASWDGTNASNLTDLQTLSGNEQNSFSVDPQFYSMTDLHAYSVYLDNEGTALSEVTDDYDGDSRSAASPSVGADEYVSPALSGIYTIGSGGDYATIAGAVNDLYLFGIKGAVTFKILDGIYNEQLNLNGAIVGSSSAQTITFTSNSNDAALVTLRHSATVSGDNFVLKINGASYLIIKNLTLSANGTDFAKVIAIENPQGNLLFSNNVFNGYSSASVLNEQDLVYSVNSGVLNNVIFRNNAFNYGYIGLHLSPPTSSVDFVLESNSFSGQIYRSVSLSSLNAPSLLSNTFDNYQNSAIDLNGCSDSTKIQKNKFSDGLRAIHLQNCAATSAANGLISNNFIHSYGDGINLENSDYFNVYFNSVNIEDSSAIQSSKSAIRLTNNTNLNIVNNVLVSAEGGHVYFVSSPGASQISNSNYNLLYYSYAGGYLASWDGVSYATLADFQTASGLDNNSVSVDPQFVSITDLHANSPLIDNEGSPIAGIDYDYDGDARSALTPSIGADEFVSNALAGSYTIGTGGDYTTIGSAINDLYSKGVKDSVTFNIFDGNYNEQLDLNGEIIGSSSVNSVTFQSNSGSASNVTIYYAASISSNFVLQIKSAKYLSFKNLTFTSNGTQYAKVVLLNNISGELTFDGNTFNGYASSGGASQNIIECFNVSVLDNFSFTNNRVNDGYIGLSLDPSASSGGLIITNNAFSSQDKDGIFLLNFDSPQITSNTISDFDTYGIYVYNCSGNLKMEKNIITNSVSVSATGIFLTLFTGTSTQRALIANNSVQTNYAGVTISSSQYVDFYFNSVNVDEGGAFVYANTMGINLAANSQISLMNNIFCNNESGYVFYAGTNSGTQVSQSDYNVFYTSYPNTKIGFWDGLAQATLSDLQTVSGNDLNSTDGAVHFTSNDDLHLAGTSITDESLLGSSLASVTDDFDEQLRNDPPTKGADEPVKKVLLSVKIFLEGPYSAGGMTQILRSNGALPLSQPYSGSPWNYNGTENVASVPANVVDWILVELRDKNSPSTIVASKAGFILINGQITDIDGTSPLEFSAIEDSYIIAVKHRNHLGVGSSVAVPLTNVSSNYDFTTGSSQFYGGNSGSVEVETGVWGMLAGDANSDGVVDAVDKNNYWRVENGTTYIYGKYSDFNLDANLDAVDKNSFWRINNGKSTQLP